MGFFELHETGFIGNSLPSSRPCGQEPNNRIILTRLEP
ncbi:hypothetical protein PoMZ_08338, partial [Pyricularia oryzae]